MHSAGSVFARYATNNLLKRFNHVLQCQIIRRMHKIMTNRFTVANNSSHFATFVRNCPPDSHVHENGITPPDGSSLSGLWASNPQIHPIRTILPCCRLPSIPACGHLNPPYIRRATLAAGLACVEVYGSTEVGGCSCIDAGCADGRTRATAEGLGQPNV